MVSYPGKSANDVILYRPKQITKRNKKRSKPRKPYPSSLSKLYCKQKVY